MTVLDDIRRAQTDPVSRVRRSVPLPSLAQQKSAALLERGAEKESRLFPQDTADNQQQQALDLFSSGPRTERGRVSPSLLFDMAQSSVLGGAGRISDFGKERINDVFDTNLDASLATGFSNQQTADTAAGVSQFERERYQQDIQDVTDAVAAGEYGEAGLQALQVGPQALADSAVTALELALGTGLTAVAPPLGAAALATTTGRKAKKAVDLTAKGVEAVRGAKAGQRVRDAAAAGFKGVTKATASTSLLNADMVQAQVEEYRQEHGKDPSKAQLATMLALNIGPAALQGKIIKDMFLPKLGKPSPSLKKFKKTMNDLVKYGDESTVKSIAKHVAEGVPKVIAAAGAEAGQEYVQTWAQILGNNLDVDNPENLFQSAYESITNPENRDEAVTASFIGAGAGGSAKAGIGAPKVVAKVTGDVAKGITKVAVNKIDNVIAKGDINILSPEERESVRQDYEAQRVVTEKKVTEFDKQLERLNEIESMDDITSDDEFSPLINDIQKRTGLTDEEFTDPENFSRVKDGLQRAIKAKKFAARASFEGSRLGKMGKFLGGKAARATKQAAEDAVKVVTEADSETVIGTIRDLSIKGVAGIKPLAEEAVASVKEIKSSTALGIVEAGNNAATAKTRDLVKQAGSLTVADIRRTAAGVAENNPKLADALNKLADQKNKVKESAGQLSAKLVENTPAPIKDIVSKGKIASENLVESGVVLAETLAGKISNEEVLGELKEALRIYKEGVAANPSLEGVFSSARIKELEGKIQRAGERLAEGSNTVAQKAADAVVKATEAIKEKVNEIKTPTETEATTESADTASGPAPEPEAATRGVFSDLNTLFEQVSEGEQQQAVAVFDRAVKSLQKKGAIARDTVDKLIEEFPALANDAVRKVVDKYFPPADDATIRTEEDFDSVPTKEMSEADIKAAYERDFPGCKI